MAHLADELPDGTAPRRGTVTGLAQELRDAFDRRLAATAATSPLRRRDESDGDDDAVGDRGRDGDGEVSRPTESVGGS